MKKILIILFFLVCTGFAQAVNYTWVGGTSSDWNTPANWIPNTGVPDAADEVTINNASPVNNCTLDAPRSIVNLTVSAGTLTLNTFVLTVTGTATISGGTIGAGELSCNRVLSGGAVYLSGVTIRKTGIGQDIWTGGNTFGKITIINTTSDFIRMADISGDNFTDSATFINTGTGILDVAYNDNTTFAGNVTLVLSAGTLKIGTNGGISTIASGSALLNGGVTAGTLRLYNITQNGTAPNSNNFAPAIFGCINTQLGGDFGVVTTGSVTINTCSFTASNILTGGSILLTNANNLSTVSGATVITKTGSGDNAWTGGNNFGKIKVINTAANFIRMADISGDTFTDSATFINTGTGILDVAYNGINAFAGNVTLALSAGTLKIGANGGTVTIPSGSALLNGGVTAGTLNLKNITQNGTAANANDFAPVNFIARNIVLGGNIGVVATGNDTLNACSFTASNIITGANVVLSNANNLSTVSGRTVITKTGGLDNTWTGGNTFGKITIVNNDNNFIRMANVSGDIFTDSAIFIQSSTGLLQPAYNGTNIFLGNIYAEGTSTAVTFGTGNGTVDISGNGGLQTFSGTATPRPVVRRLVMSTANNGVLTLAVPVNISVSLTMTTGNINTDVTNILTLTDETTTTTIGSASSFVNGPMQYNVIYNSTTRATLNFPIGKDTSWRPASLQLAHNNTTSYTYRAEMFNSSAYAFGWTHPANVYNVSNVRYWNIDRYLTSTMVSNPATHLQTGAVSGPLVTLYYGVDDEVYDPANLTICKNTSGAPTTWLDIVGTAAGTPTGSVTSTSTAFNSFSTFTIANLNGGNNPLPVDLLSFDFAINDQQVNLVWKVSTEKNVESYKIEKSVNGVDWELLEKVSSVGFSEYSVIDYAPVTGNNYYRLLQKDNDGKTAIYGPLNARFNVDVTPEWKCYPVPVDNMLNIYAGHHPSDISMKLYTANGVLLHTYLPMYSVGAGLYKFDVSSLIPGLYVLQITDNLGNIKQLKLTKN